MQEQGQRGKTKSCRKVAMAKAMALEFSDELQVMAMKRAPRYENVTGNGLKRGRPTQPVCETKNCL
jgi:hypothetical protein